MDEGNQEGTLGPPLSKASPNQRQFLTFQHMRWSAPCHEGAITYTFSAAKAASTAGSMAGSKSSHIVMTCCQSKATSLSTTVAVIPQRRRVCEDCGIFLTKILVPDIHQVLLDQLYVMEEGGACVIVGTRVAWYGREGLIVASAVWT